MPVFEKVLKSMGLDEETLGKIERLLGEAGNEFPCLSCASRGECASFKCFEVVWNTKITAPASS
jgi:hypothetical protein